MTSERYRSPEAWDAADIIDSLKGSLPVPGQEPEWKGVCSQHPHIYGVQNAQTRALIFIVRRLDLNGRSKTRNSDGSRNFFEIGKGYIKAGGWPSVVAALLVCMFVYIRYFQPQKIKEVATEVVAEAKAELLKGP